VNMRPQHITDSFLIKPIAESDRPNAFGKRSGRSRRTRARAKKNRLVERSYYVVYVWNATIRVNSNCAESSGSIGAKRLPPGASADLRDGVGRLAATLPIRTGLQHQ